MTLQKLIDHLEKIKETTTGDIGIVAVGGGLADGVRVMPVMANGKRIFMLAFVDGAEDPSE